MNTVPYKGRPKSVEQELVVPWYHGESHADAFCSPLTSTKPTNRLLLMLLKWFRWSYPTFIVAPGFADFFRRAAQINILACKWTELNI